MKNGVHIEGLNGIKKKLKSHTKLTEQKTENAFKIGLLWLIGKAVKLAPIDTGILRNSAFTDVTKSKNTISGTLGFTAEYAAWVHNMKGKLKGKKRADFGKTRQGVKFGGGSGKGTYWSGGEPRFLEKAVMRNQDKFIEIIKKNIEVD